MPDKLFMPTHPSAPFSHGHTRTYHQPDSSPPGLAQWACYIKASAYGSRVGWTPAERYKSQSTRAGTSQTIYYSWTKQTGGCKASTRPTPIQPTSLSTTEYQATGQQPSYNNYHY